MHLKLSPLGNAGQVTNIENNFSPRATGESQFKKTHKGANIGGLADFEYEVNLEIKKEWTMHNIVRTD